MAVNRVKRNGSYAPLSAHYYKDDAIDEAGESAELLYVRGLAFCADVLSDGFISDRQLVRFVGVGMFDAPDRAARLVEVGLWERVEGGYEVRSWLDWNRSRAEITDIQKKDAARKRPAEKDSETPDPTPPNGDRDTSERTPNGIQPDSAEGGQGTLDGVAEDSTPLSSAGAHARSTYLHSTPLHDNATPVADAPRKRGTRLPADWAVTPDLVAWVQDRCPDVDGRRETERFTNHFHAAAGQKGVKLDWVKTYKNWMLEEQTRAEQRGRARTGQTATARAVASADQAWDDYEARHGGGTIHQLNARSEGA